MNNKNFYNSISDFYDEMVSFDNSVNSKKKLFPNFIRENYKTALDLGCGSGADSIALSSLGLKVSAFDNSSKMLDAARRNSEKYNCKIKFYEYDLTKPKKIKLKTDFVISIGNTLANIPLININRIFKHVYKMINAGGSFLFQILNYDRILHRKERLICSTENEKMIYVRFYDFENNILGFNVLSISKANVKDVNLFTTKIYPHSKEDLTNSLKSAGFSRIQIYGSLQKEKFIKRSSKDLVIHSIK